MRQFLESPIVFRLHLLWKKDLPPETRDVDKEVRIYGSDGKIDNITTTVILLIGLGMLVAPIWILAIVANAYSKLGVIAVFIVIFLSIVYATVAKPAETLAATAAYVRQNSHDEKLADIFQVLCRDDGLSSTGKREMRDRQYRSLEE
jgi:hypothetical protein